MSSAPVFKLPDFSKPFEIETDARRVGVGVVLMQEGRPLAYMSKVLCPRNQAHQYMKKEFLVVLMIVQRWKHYLQGHFFIIRTISSHLNTYYSRG